jgi:hypothetical protein
VAVVLVGVVAAAGAPAIEPACTCCGVSLLHAPSNISKHDDRIQGRKPDGGRCPFTLE